LIPLQVPRSDARALSCVDNSLKIHHHSSIQTKLRSFFNDSITSPLVPEALARMLALYLQKSQGDRRE
jgi:hypothetical protein